MGILCLAKNQEPIHLLKKKGRMIFYNLSIIYHRLQLLLSVCFTCSQIFDSDHFFLSLLKCILPLNIVTFNYVYTPSFLIIFLTLLLSSVPQFLSTLQVSQGLCLFFFVSAFLHPYHFNYQHYIALCLSSNFQEHVQVSYQSLLIDYPTY